MSWSDTSNCASVTSTGSAGAFLLRVVGECASTVLTATVDDLVNSSSVSVCIETMVGVQVSASFYPSGQAVSGAVAQIPCSIEYHRVQATAACSTTAATRPAVSSAVSWLVGDGPAGQQSSVVVSMTAESVDTVATIGTWNSSLTLTRSSSESSFTVAWSPPSTISLWQGSQATYTPSVTFDNGVTAALDGSYTWLSASTLISGYSSSNPHAVSVDGAGTLTLLANARSQVLLTLTPCQGLSVERLAWANLLPAASDLDLSTSSTTSNVGQQLAPASSSRVRFYVFANIPSGLQLRQAEAQLVQEEQPGGGYALQAASGSETHGDDYAAYDLTRDTSVVGSVNRIYQPIFNLITSGATYLTASSRRQLFWFEMERASGTSSATASLSLRIVNLKFSDDSAVVGVVSTAANGTIEVQGVSSASISKRPGRRLLFARQGRRRLATYSQSDFVASCSTLTYDIDANGVVEQADIEMFTYYLLNRQALNKSAFCPQLLQWLDPNLDGRANTKDWIYFWQANANNKLLVTRWQSQCSDGVL